MKKILFICFATTLFFACNKVECDPASHEISLGKTVTLGLDESAVVKNKNFKITFLEISEDSRCPEGAMCIWEGQALAQFLIENGNDSKNDSLSTISRPELGWLPSKEVFNRTVHLLEVAPHPVLGKEIDPKDYKVTIKVE